MKPPRFTLRDLFWLVLVVGLLLGWAFDHGRERERLNRLQYAKKYLQGGFAVQNGWAIVGPDYPNPPGSAR